MTTILLTPAETTLQQLLLDVADYIERLPAAEVPQQSLPATPNIHGADKLRLRFTGGWVRDKLLGIPSNDIDVGISSMTGYQFGLRLHEYLSLSGNLEKYNSQVFSPSPGEKPIEGLGSTESKKAELGGLHKIVANPEKSKHLETVTTRILGFDVDLVNLRKETYAADSRNPQMEFGSPEEDALRRDATINALFYNLHTSEIEDFTARGLDDLKAQLIITPLESFQTFMDDPLRVLRLVRFASRLKFNIDPKTQLSMANFQIKQSFREKISRERVGVEVEKMLKGKYPYRSLALIDSLELFDIVFIDPTMAEVGRVDTKNWRAAYSCVSQCTCDQTDFVSPEIARNFAIVKSVLFIDSEDEYLSWMISALAPWLDHPSMDPTSKSELSIAVVSARTALKLSNKVCEVIGGAFAHFREVISMKDTFNQQLRPTAASPSKQVVGCDELGMMIRLWGRNWRSYVMLAMIREAVDHYVHRRELSEFYLIIESYAVFLGHIKEQGLIEAWNFKPVVNGKELARALGVKPGPWTGAALNMVMEWQLRNPDSTDSSGALEEVKSRVDELALP